jgi:DnaJ family protein C protein 13
LTQEQALELVTKSLTGLLRAQPSLLELVPIMGYIQGFIRNLSSKKTDIAKSSMKVLRQLSNSPLCVSSIINTPTTLSQIMTAIRQDGSLTGVACETLDKLFSANSDSFLQQALEADVVSQLLMLLDSRQSSHSSSTKALIVQVLKNMMSNETYGEQVSLILDQSSVWSEFKDQKHDLFITQRSTEGYLTG